MKSEIDADRNYTLYVPPSGYGPETREILEFIEKEDLYDRVKIVPVIDANTWGFLEVIVGTKIRLPVLEQQVLCETVAILGFMGKDEIIKTLRDYETIS